MHWDNPTIGSVPGAISIVISGENKTKHTHTGKMAKLKHSEYCWYYLP